MVPKQGGQLSSRLSRLQYGYCEWYRPRVASFPVVSPFTVCASVRGNDPVCLLVARDSILLVWDYVYIIFICFEYPPTPPGVLRRVRASLFTLSLSLSQTGSKSRKLVRTPSPREGEGDQGGEKCTAPPGSGLRSSGHNILFLKIQR